MTRSEHQSPSLLICGAGIAGLTLAALLKEQGWDPLVIEREPAASSGGYMMDFYGSGWDVAERLGLTGKLRAIHYPIDVLRYVDSIGRAYLEVPIARVRRALGGRYVYLLRSDLERILLDRALGAGVRVQYGTQVASLRGLPDRVEVTFDDGSACSFDLVIGADGVHSQTRALAFCAESEVTRYLGCYFAAFSAAIVDVARGAVALYEEPDRVSFYYALNAEHMDAFYIFRTEQMGRLAPAERIALLRKEFASCRWMAQRELAALTERQPILLDALLQVVMPRWSCGRVCLLGDACGCLSPLAGQGSHMAMAGAYVLAAELARTRDDYTAAFQAYERFLKPLVQRKQAAARNLEKRFVPTRGSSMWLRRLVMRAIFSPALLSIAARAMGSRSVLRGYPPPDR